MFFLFLLKNIDCSTRKNRLAEAVLTSTHNLCFEQKYEKYQNFYLKIFSFLMVKFSLYLNRLVFVMNVNPGESGHNDPTLQDFLSLPFRFGVLN